MRWRSWPFVLVVFVAAVVVCQSASSMSPGPNSATPPPRYDMERFARDGWSKMPEAWFRSDQAAKFAENVLSWQLPSGGWPKRSRMHLQARPPETAHAERGSFDNSASIPQMRFLGNMAQATGEVRYRQAFLKGVDFVLEAQLPCGGWPQAYPPREGYQELITYNDGAMIHVMTFLREVAGGRYAFVDAERIAQAQAAVDRGVECILKTQVVVDGERTVWGQQHDPVTFAPAKARTFELPYLTAAESTGVVLFLMEMEQPSAAVRQAIRDAIRWMRRHALSGIRTERTEDDVVVVADPNAGPLWARFYDRATGKPVFVGRDGVPKDALDQIDRERRTGYRWYGDWPRHALDRYEAWCAKHGEALVE